MSDINRRVEPHRRMPLYQFILPAMVGWAIVLLAIAASAWAQGDWSKTWVFEDDTYVAGLSAMAIGYDDTGTPEYHFVYEKILAADATDRRLYYRRYQNGAWEAELEISHRIAQPAGIITPDQGISYLPSITTGEASDNVHISARLDCTTTPVTGQSSFSSCANAALQIEEILVDPDNRTYTARPIDVTHPISYERGLSQMSMSGQVVFSCWRVELTPAAHGVTSDREVYCAQRDVNQSAWGPPRQMTGGRAGDEYHGYLLHPANHPKRLSFTTYHADYADPKAVAIRLNAPNPTHQPKWITISDPQRQGDYSWLAEDARQRLHVVWQEADANSERYEIWHAECQAGTTTACSQLGHWDKGMGSLSQTNGSAKYPQMLITPNDDVLVAYQQQVNNKWRIRVAYRCHHTSDWKHVTPDSQFDDQTLWLGEPALVQDPRGGEVHVVYQVMEKATGRLRVRWAKHSYPACTAPALASLSCSRAGMPDFSAQGVQSVGEPTSDPPPLLKRTLTGSESKCNDGSPAVMYIRPAFEAADQMSGSNRWIIHLQGGRNCTHADDCRDRWCSEGMQRSYSAGKMSSIGLPVGIRSPGIFSLDTHNGFRSFNHVFVYYCSSDNWMGAASPHVYSSEKGDYRIEFRGAAIVAEVIRTLKADTGTWSDPFDGEHRVWVPDIDDATQVLLTGSSAGSIGLRHHLDRLRRHLVKDNPQVAVQAVVDVGFLPSLKHEAMDWTDPDSPAGYDAWMVEQWEMMQSFWQARAAQLDQSCIQQSRPKDRKRCLDVAYVLKHHVTTPFFISQDLNDPVVWNWLNDWKLMSNEYELAQIVHDELLDLSTAGIESRPVPPGIFGPHCGAHELLSNDSFFGVSIGQKTFYQTLYDWVIQPERSEVLQADTDARPPYSQSNGCP